MFDFERLEVYHKAKRFNKQITLLLKKDPFDRGVKDQLRRASFSIMLNIAEGSGRNSRADKRNFYVIARGSAFECAAIFDFLRDLQVVEKELVQTFYSDLEEISKMLFAMIKSLNAK